MLLALLFALPAAVHAQGSRGDGPSTLSPQWPDSDGDGLPDEWERHKYLSSPNQRDTGGDRISDGDWAKRRQFTTSLRAVVRVLKPCLTLPSWDDFQDARVVRQTPQYAELEVVTYLWNPALEPRRLPEFKVKAATRRTYSRLAANLFWREETTNQVEWLRPRPACNWDAALRAELREELLAAGIDLDQLTDLDMVETVSTWLLANSRCLSRSPFAYMIGYADGGPSIARAFQAKAQQELPADYRNPASYAALMGSGKAMWESRSYEWGLPWCVYLATALRAMGIPTRIAQFIPALQPGDPELVKAWNEGARPASIREYILDGARYAFNNQLMQDQVQVITMNEVLVGNRWVLLALPRDLTGLQFPAAPLCYRLSPGTLLRVQTFADPAEVDYASTWARQISGTLRIAELPGPAPWRVLSLTSLVGRNNRLIINAVTNSDDFTGNWGDLMAGEFQRPPQAAMSIFFNISPRYATYQPDASVATRVKKRATDEVRKWTVASFDLSDSALKLRQSGKTPAGPIATEGPKPANAQPGAATGSGSAYSVKKAIWFDSPLRPVSMPPMLVNPGDGGAHLLLQTERGAGAPSEENFLRLCPRRFRLCAGSECFNAELMPVYWQGWFLLRMASKDREAMKPGVDYRLSSAAKDQEYRWEIRPGVAIRRAD